MSFNYQGVDYDTTYLDDSPLDEQRLNNFIITNIKVLNGCRHQSIVLLMYSMICYNVRQSITKEKIIKLENENERLIQSIKKNEKVYYHIIFLICSMWGFSVYVLLKYGLNI
jgi:hypothetical protein